MLHSFVVEGCAYRLRPIGDDDAILMASLRGDPELNSYIHHNAGGIETQLQWLADYYLREGDYYFVIERRSSNSREGLIALYDVNFEIGSAEWGRWVIKKDSFAAIESTLLIYQFGFELLGLNRVYSRTVASNFKVVSFHQSCGIVDGEVLKNHFELNGVLHDAVEHSVNKSDWIDIKLRLEKTAHMLAQRINHA